MVNAKNNKNDVKTMMKTRTGGYCIILFIFELSSILIKERIDELEAKKEMLLKSFNLLLKRKWTLLKQWIANVFILQKFSKSNTRNK